MIRRKLLFIFYLFPLLVFGQYLDEENRKIPRAFLKDSVVIDTTFIIETSYRFGAETEDVFSLASVLIKPEMELTTYNYFDYKSNAINFVFYKKGKPHFNYVDSTIYRGGKEIFLDNKGKYKLIEKRMRLTCYLGGYQEVEFCDPANNKLYQKEILLYAIDSVQPSQRKDTISKTRVDTNTIEYKWPYIQYNTPPFIGLLLGYNFYADRALEIGTIINVADLNISTKTGAIFGPSLSYKRFIDKGLNCVNLDVGVYGVLALGIGANYTYANKDGMLGVKPFIGLALYNFQLTYGYNFFSKKQNENFNLGHSNITLKLAIPICKLFTIHKYKYRLN